jgi:hypothetical protein
MMATNPNNLGLPPGFVLDTNPTSPTPILQRQPAPQTPAQAAKDQAEARGANANADILEHKASEEAGADKKQKAQQLSGAESADQLLSGVRRARALVSNWSTGLGGAVLDHVPASQAAQLDTIINQEIRGNIFLNRINDLKESNPSPNGGTGIGRIMQAEIPLITGSVGALDPVKMGRQGTLDSLNEIEARTLRMKAIINGENPDDPAVQKKYKIPAIPTYAGGSLSAPPPSAGATPSGDGGTPPKDPGSQWRMPDGDIGFNNPGDPRGEPLNPHQEGAYDAWMKANRGKSGEDLNQFLAGIGAPVMQNADKVMDTYNQTGQYAASSQGRFLTPDISDARGNKSLETVDAGIRSVANLVPFSDEISAAGDTLTKGGKYTGNLAYERTIDDYDFEHHFPTVAGATIAGALLTPSKARGVAAAAKMEALASGASEMEARAVAAKAFGGQLAKEGGAYGVASGAGSEGDLGDRAEKAVLGGAVGAVVGKVGGKLFRGKTPEVVAGGPSAKDIGQAMLDEGIPGGRPIADATKRGKMAVLEATTGGHAPVRESLDRTRMAIADKVAGVSTGEAQMPGAIGETIQGAGKRTLKAAKEAASGVYKQAETVAGDTPIHPVNALNRLDSYIAKLSRNPETNAGVVSYLRDVRRDLTVLENHPVDTGIVDQNGHAILRPGAPPEPKTLADLRDIATGANDKINFQNLQKTRAEGIMVDVGQELNKDITTGLQTANPQALALYNKADGMWSEMSNLRRQVVQKLLGPANNPLSGEQTMSRIRNMMGNKGDLKRFQRVVNMMTPEEKADLGATLFGSVGQRSPEEPFSPAVFLSQTKDIQPEALKTVFGDQAAKSILNLRVASRGFADAQSSLNNSRSGFIQNMKGFVSNIINLKSTTGAAIGYAAGGVPGAIAGAVAGEATKYGTARISAKMLMNPDVSSWLRKLATAKTEKEARGLIVRLNRMAVANVELQSFRNVVVNAANDNFGRVGSVAASPEQRPNQQK